MKLIYFLERSQDFFMPEVTICVDETTRFSTNSL